jgi:uncharacterized membrane protein
MSDLLKQKNKEAFLWTKVVGTIFVSIIIIYLCGLAIRPPVPEDCWSHYDTEQSAIEHCENHD